MTSTPITVTDPAGVPRHGYLTEQGSLLMPSQGWSLWASVESYAAGTGLVYVGLTSRAAGERAAAACKGDDLLTVPSSDLTIVP